MVLTKAATVASPSKVEAMAVAHGEAAPRECRVAAHGEYALDFNGNQLFQSIRIFFFCPNHIGIKLHNI